MRRKNKRTLLSCCIVLALILACAIVLKMSRGPLLFRRYVLKPIPKSVKNIKVARPWEMSGHRYVMHFRISKADLALILNSKPFKKMMDVSYDNGNLSWSLDIHQGEGLSLYSIYGDGRSGPEWFRPNDWKSPEVYRFKEMTIEYRRHMQILIYNGELAEAYFVEYQAGHW